MSLDDNHESVVLACAKVINVMLSYDMNEIYFDYSEVTFLSVYFFPLKFRVLYGLILPPAESSRSGGRCLHSPCFS